MHGQLRNGGSRFTKYGSMAGILPGLLLAACLILISGESTDAQIVIKPLKITTTSLPDGAVGADYSATLSATGSKAPYVWSIAAGVLPNGLNLSATGVISGTPAFKQYDSFTIKAQDAAGTNVTRVFGINIILVPKLRSFSPAPFSNSAARMTSIDATFNEPIRDPSSVTFSVHGSMSGRMPGTYSGGWTPSLSFQPNRPLWPGEEVEVTLTRGLLSNDGIALGMPAVTHFRAATAQSGASYFGELFQFGNDNDYLYDIADIKLVDLNGDGVMDIVNSDSFHGITLHVYSTFYQRYEMTLITNGRSSFPYGWEDIVLGDMDADGDFDIVGAREFDSLDILFNDGTGAFNAQRTIITDINDRAHLDLGDVDADGDLDVLLNVPRSVTSVFINDGTGGLSEDNQRVIDPFYEPSIFQGKFGDMDGDGDLDVFASMQGGLFRYRIYFNDGIGNFSLEREFEGEYHSDVAPLIELGDFDNDGDLDFVSAYSKSYIRDRSKLYFNEGSAVFIQSIFFGEGAADDWLAIESGDMNGDGYLDLIVGVNGQNRVYLTDSIGFLRDMRPFGIGYENDDSGTLQPVLTNCLDVGDIDGDGDLDIAAHHFRKSSPAGQRNRVYENR